MIFEIGTVCVKLAGRDAGKRCVIVDTIDDSFVLIDGQTRRRKCNVCHLEPTKQKLSISKGADSSAVKSAFKEIGVEVLDVKSKKVSDRPVKAHRQHDKPAKKK
ncbi:50S ribosomal protein L14e [Candidatus Woesearchaeota archaeon]|nr:50S ribosomal protein L14e [Candidatus Woesearchaeota archaeon]